MFPPRLGSTPFPLRTEFLGDRFHPSRPGLVGLDFSYGYQVEPRSGRYFHCCRWANRPAFFLHFVVFRRGIESLPRPLFRRCFDSRCGGVSYAVGYGLRGRRGFYWANHTWFFWRERGVRWAASLHYFGRPETTALLARLLRELRPARALG